MRSPGALLRSDLGLIAANPSGSRQRNPAIFAAYGWPTDLTDEQILERLVALNAERAAEEARGLVRWLRPEFQAPQAGGAKQTELDLPDDELQPAGVGTLGRKKSIKDGKTPLALESRPQKSAKAAKLAWPKERAQRTKVVQEALAAATSPLEPAEIAKLFTRGRADQVTEILAALCALGLARKSRGRYSRA